MTRSCFVRPEDCISNSLQGKNTCTVAKKIRKPQVNKYDLNELFLWQSEGPKYDFKLESASIIGAGTVIRDYYTLGSSPRSNTCYVSQARNFNFFSTSNFDLW